MIKLFKVTLKTWRWVWEENHKTNLSKRTVKLCVNK